MRQQEEKLSLCAIITSLTLIITISLTTIIAPITIAHAAEQQKLSEASATAIAQWIVSSPSVNIVTAAELGVRETSGVGTDIFLSATIRQEGGSEIDVFGQLFTTQDVLDIDPQLDSAHLSPVSVDVCSGEIDENGNCLGQEFTLTVQADWVGVGEETHEEKTKIRILEDGTRTIIKETFASNNAIATGTINGQDLGDTGGAGEVATLFETKRSEAVKQI